MALTTAELAPNAKINVDGAEGAVIQTDSLVTYVSRDSGKVDVYMTQHLLDNGELYVPPETSATPATEGSAPAADPAQSAAATPEESS